MKDIEGHEGRYAITEDGQVWSHLNKCWLKLRGSGYINKIKRRKRDYVTIALWKKERGYQYFYVHRLVAKAFVPNPLNHPLINHKDGNQKNNSKENLEWCTHKENMRHAFVNGLTTRGEKNTSTKLTVEQVLEIRKLFSEGGLSQDKIAVLFGVSQSNIYMIVNRKNWTWI